LTKEHSAFVHILKTAIGDSLNIQRLMANAAVLKYCYKPEINIGVYVCKLLCNFRLHHLAFTDKGAIRSLTLQEDIIVSTFVANYRAGKLEAFGLSPLKVVKSSCEEAWDKIKLTLNNN
jgi:hypothetical protein